MESIIGLAIVLAVLWLGGTWLRSKPGGLASTGADPAPTLRQSGKCFREVVGESNYRPALAAIANDGHLPGLGIQVTAALICENNNRFDANAVRVDIRGRTVGYLSAGDAVDYRERLTAAGLGEATQWVAACVAGGGKGRHYGVYLDLPDRIA